MVLNIQGEEVLGYYYYHRYRSKMLLEGTLMDSILTLNEAPGVAEPRAVFTGRMQNNEITGHWSYTYREEEHPFRAHVTSTVPIQAADSFTGNYSSTRESADFLGDTDIRFIADSTYAFEFHTATQNCIGDVWNVIELAEEGKGTFAGRLCEGINLSFAGDTLTVTQASKCLYHGFFGCHFAGTYIKE